MIAGPPFELVYQYLPVYEDAFWRFRALFQFMPSAVVTSWYRDPAHNAEVGGAPQSQHLIGLAVDAVVPPAEQQRFREVATWLDLVAVIEPAHIHVQRYKAGILPAFLFKGE